MSSIHFLVFFAQACLILSFGSVQAAPLLADVEPVVGGYGSPCAYGAALAALGLPPSFPGPYGYGGGFGYGAGLYGYGSRAYALNAGYPRYAYPQPSLGSLGPLGPLGPGPVLL